MLDFSSTLKSHNKEKDNSITNSNLNDKSISASLISDTSPVYLFCTSKNGINSKNENGWTPIYCSIIANNLVALNELLNLGSDPNITNNLGETPLYLCVDIDNYDALIILLQYNADTNIAKKNGTTPLHLATKKNKDNFMHALLRNKANPNLQNKLYSQTATHIAILNKINEDMLNIFYEYNADIYNIKDKYDKTPFDYAKELKDDEYVQLIIKIFGDKKNRKEPKTLNINKLPEEFKKNNDIILNIPKILHNSNYNIPPETISFNQNNEKENKIIEIFRDKKLENNEKDRENIKKNINESDDNPKKYGILSSGDPLYSDRSNYQDSESNKSKKDDIKTDINILLNKNNLSEFQSNPSNIENNEIKHKNSLIKNLKNNINIDTKMIDNSKDIILLNNENNDSGHKKGNNNNLVKNEENKIKFEIEKEKNNLNLNFFNKVNENNDNNIESKINIINDSNDENKLRGDNTDKEIIKNIISSTVKKIKVNTNTFNSEYSALNNNSINQNNNNSNSKVEVLKLINFSSNNLTNNENIENKLSNNTNLDNYIISNTNNLEDGTSSFILYNSKNKENEQKNNCISEKMKISDITPISNNKVDNQTHTDNSNIFSEIQINNTSNENYKKDDIILSQNEIEIKNKEFLEIKNEQITKDENINKNNNVNNENVQNNEKNNSLHNENKNNNILTNSSEKYLYDGSLEYSKSKSYIANEISLNNQNQNNNNLANIINNNPLINQHHRQLSYHNNKCLINKRKKDGENQNEESYNISINKENDNPNNNEIIYYNKNYLAGNNTSKKDENIPIKEKNTVIQKNIPEKKHTQSDLDNNIQRYKSITNKTSSINQKVFTYTSPNMNKKNYLINTKLNSNNIDYNIEKENINIENNNNLNNIILNTNPNMNISNLNGTKEEFFSINNNLSSFLNTNKIGSIKDKQNTFLRDSHNKDNSTFKVYDDIVEIKNLDKKVNLYSANQNEEKNNSNDDNNNNKNLKNDNIKRNNYRGSSMGNTTISSLTKNIINPGKQSLTSIINNNNTINSSNIIITDRNSNNNIMNQSNNIIKNIPVNILLRLRDWLISCDLLCYYNVLIENNMYDIDKYINDLQNNKLNISYKEIEDLGIRKPGHIFRLLLKLEIDSGILDNNLFNYILSKFNMSSSISNNIILTSSISDINCCGICNKNKNYQSYIKRNDCPYNDIFSFLKYKDLWKYKENFLHNGFDQLEYVLLQLFSKYSYDKDVMNDCFHIYNENDKIYVLNKLYEEKRTLALECGINSDENEINHILSNCSYSLKYSSKKINNNYLENTNKTSNENNCCYIF